MMRLMATEKAMEKMMKSNPVNYLRENQYVGKFCVYVS